MPGFERRAFWITKEHGLHGASGPTTKDSGHLIPFEQYVHFYQHSHFLTVPIVLRSSRFPTFSQDVITYFNTNFTKQLDQRDCTFWIHRSTGRLCADLATPHTVPYIYLYESWIETDPKRLHPWNAPNKEGMIIESLTLEDYHGICTFHLPRSQIMTIFTHLPVTLGTVVSLPPTNRLENSVGIAFFPNAKAYPRQWRLLDILKLECWLSPSDYESWLTQANYIFSRLHTTSNFEDCVVLDSVEFEVKILPNTDEPPTGFLFLCPGEDFQSGPSSVCWPDFPAYWCLDPSGVERLSAEEATDFGLPSLELTTRVGGYSWDNIVYAEIRKFQRVKGFDPESQDIARHVRFPLYYPFNELDAPFAHVNEKEEYYSGDDDKDQMEDEEGDHSADDNEEEDVRMNLKDDEDQMDLSW
ncbi:hypothetical protein B0H19DRAFT_1351802 [Mycena capillaripes]|nr:hypothetical protein B0H19DRAFT_1351802 [Mycena capillaripes]